MTAMTGTVKVWEHDGLRAEMVVTAANRGYATHATAKNAVAHAHGATVVDRVIRERFGIRPC